MARAEKALAAHRYTHARPDFQAILQAAPDNRRAQLALVQIHIAQEEPESALRILDTMASQGPPTPELRLLRAETMLMLGRYDDAMAVVAEDRSAQAWRIRAIAHTGRNELDQVLPAFESGVRAQGNRARLLSDYAHFRLSQGDIAGAADLARQAVSADRTDEDALLVSGDVEMASNRPREALAWYSRAARTYPESRPALMGQIAMLAELKQFDKVAALVKAGRIARPEDTELLYFEALLAAENKDWAKTRTLLQPYEDRMETMPDASALYAEALIRLGQVDLAISRLSSQLLREPENRKARMLLGEAKLASQDPEGALETLAPVAGWADASPQELALLAKAQAQASGV